MRRECSARTASTSSLSPPHKVALARDCRKSLERIHASVSCSALECVLARTEMNAATDLDAGRACNSRWVALEASFRELFCTDEFSTRPAASRVTVFSRVCQEKLALRRFRSMTVQGGRQSRAGQGETSGSAGRTGLAGLTGSKPASSSDLHHPGCPDFICMRHRSSKCWKRVLASAGEWRSATCRGENHEIPRWSGRCRHPGDGDMLVAEGRLSDRVIGVGQ